MDSTKITKIRLFGIPCIECQQPAYYMQVIGVVTEVAHMGGQPRCVFTARDKIMPEYTRHVGRQAGTHRDHRG